MRAAALAALLLLLGCSRAAPGSKAPTGGPAAELEAPKTGTFQEPIVRCGARDSYVYVAREFRCKNGTNPFHGDLQMAQDALAGAKRHPQSGHFVDSYSVPCPEGAVTVFVDMYGCAEARAMLDERPSPDFLKAAESFDRGDFRSAVEACLGIIDGEKVDRNVVECLALTPAAMTLSGGGSEAENLVGAFCGKIRGAEVRAQHVAHVARWIARGGKGRLSREQFRAIVGRFAAVCGLDDGGQGA